jgi:hypothetical protein
MALTAISLLQRSRNEPDFVAQIPDRPQINRKLEFQREAISWISACLAVAYYKNNGLARRDHLILFEQISSLINFMNLVNVVRGRQHGADGLIFTSEQAVVDNFLYLILLRIQLICLSDCVI